MSLVQTTGFLSVVNGQKTTLNVPATTVISARIRWKGKSTFVEGSSTNSGTYSASFPSPPAGYTVAGGEATFAVTLTANSVGAQGTVEVSAPGGSASTSYSLGPNASARISASTACSGTGTASGSYTLTGPSGGSVTGSNPVTYATTYYRKETPSQNISVTINSQTIIGPASLLDGVISDWYPVTNLIPGDNTLIHSVSGSGMVYVEIEYTYQPMPPKPQLVAPEHLYVTESKTPSFEFVLLPATGSDATTYHGKIALSLSPSMGDPITADSSQSQTGWQYWDGLQWQPMPVAGVSANTKVRYTPVFPISAGVWYWAATTRDNWGLGETSDARILRVVLSVNALEGYSLSVGSVGYKCIDLEVTETANGEIGTIRFTVNNTPDPVTGKRAFDVIQYTDPVYVSVYDSTGYVRQYVGRVWQKRPNDVALEVIATMGDKILADRIVKADYLNTDIGAALSSIITTYCTPVYATGIPNPIGITANLASKNQSALDVFKQVFEIWGLLFWNDTNATDWVQYLCKPTSLTCQGIYVRYGEGI